MSAQCRLVANEPSPEVTAYLWKAAQAREPVFEMERIEETVQVHAFMPPLYTATQPFSETEGQTSSPNSSSRHEILKSLIVITLK